MIRDEFKNTDKAVIKKKTNRKMIEMGERAYYSKKLSFLNDMFKPVKISTIFCLVCFLLPSILYIAVLIVDKKYVLPVTGYVVFVITGLLICWTIVWFAVLVPHFKKKIEFYKEQLAEINRAYIKKINGIK